MYFSQLLHFPFVIFSHQELQVRVQGARPGNILFLIHEVLESLISESFSGVTYDFLLPCPECLAMNVSDANSSKI